jgi:dTDP-4-amino-4,6-dideoxygalactose transaminase
MYQALLLQLNRIEDIEKAKRRIVAFYKEALKHTDAQNFMDDIQDFKYLINRDIDL